MDRPDIASAYDRWSVAYDADDNRTRDLDAQLMRSLLAARRFGCVVEAGCGTGKNTVLLASCSERVIGLDFSAGMLEQARQRGLPQHAELQQHDLVRPWPLPPDSADLVTFNLVLEHVELLAPVFGHAAAACRRGAQVWLTELHPVRQHGGARARFADEGGAIARIDAWPRHVSDYVSAAEAAGLALCALGEHWADGDERARPRVLLLQFEKMGR